MSKQSSSKSDLSEALEERISVALGDPRVDPHCHPIPTKNGAMPKLRGNRFGT